MIQSYPTGLIETKLTEDDTSETEYFADTEAFSPASDNGRSDLYGKRRKCFKGKGDYMKLGDRSHNLGGVVWVVDVVFLKKPRAVISRRPQEGNREI